MTEPGCAICRHCHRDEVEITKRYCDHWDTELAPDVFISHSSCSFFEAKRNYDVCPCRNCGGYEDCLEPCEEYYEWRAEQDIEDDPLILQQYTPR